MYLQLSRGESKSSWRDVRWGRLTQTRSVRQRQKGDSRQNGPWTHTSDDSYIHQLSLVLATAIVSLSPPKKEGHPNGCKFTIHPTRKTQILQLPEYEFHIMIFVDTLQLHSSDIGTSKLSILHRRPQERCHCSPESLMITSDPRIGVSAVDTDAEFPEYAISRQSQDVKRQSTSVARS